MDCTHKKLLENAIEHCNKLIEACTELLEDCESNDSMHCAQLYDLVDVTSGSCIRVCQEVIKTHEKMLEGKHDIELKEVLNRSAAIANRFISCCSSLIQQVQSNSEEVIERCNEAIECADEFLEVCQDCIDVCSC